MAFLQRKNIVLSPSFTWLASTHRTSGKRGKSEVEREYKSAMTRSKFVMADRSCAPGSALDEVSEAPQPDVQRERIAEVIKLEMREGQAWCVLCSKWWQLWRAYVRFEEERPDANGGPHPTAPSAASQVSSSASPGAGIPTAPIAELSGAMDVVVPVKMKVKVYCRGRRETVNEHHVARLSPKRARYFGAKVSA